MTLHPTVPNPYTLLSLLPLRTKVYTPLDLKDAFFCDTGARVYAQGTKQQLTWTPLQGFKNFPAIFGEALASDLNSYHPEEYGCWLLQYGDDLLLAAETKEKYWKGTKTLLQLLMEAGYWVSKKAQICKEEVRYLGFVLKKDTRFQTLVGFYILMSLA